MPGALTNKPVGFSRGPISEFIISIGMPPGRRSSGRWADTSTIVDSRPILHLPESSINEISDPSESATCWAVVGLRWPDRLALGAAIGTPDSFINF